MSEGPSPRLQEIILDMFFDLFNIKPPEFSQAFIEGRGEVLRDSRFYRIGVERGDGRFRVVREGKETPGC